MSYQNLIGDEVYWGSPCYENFEVIESVQEEGNLVKVSFESEKFTRIPKEDLDLFLKNDEVQFVRKYSDGLALESMITCGKQAEIWAESF